MPDESEERIEDNLEWENEQLGFVVNGNFPRRCESEFCEEKS